MTGYTARQRRRYATIRPTTGYPTGRFPMGDQKHARLALQFLDRAKHLTPAQKAAIQARARNILNTKET